jgi:hypothetical protein
MAGPRPHEPGRSAEPDRRSAPARPPVENTRAGAGTSRRVKHLILLPGGGQEFPADGPPEPAAAPPAEQQRPRDARRTVRLPAGGHPLTGGGPARAQAAQAAEMLPLEVAPATAFRVKLRVISRSVTQSRAPGMPFIIFASAIVTLAVLGLVVLRVMVDQASFRVDDLQTRMAQQQANLTELRYQDSLQEAPGRISTLAGQLGLVPAGTPQLLAGPGAPPLALATVTPATVTPATVKPTTLSPTTVTPATLSPTTVKPTTLSPATVKPTSAAPATAATVTPAQKASG